MKNLTDGGSEALLVRRAKAIESWQSDDGLAREVAQGVQVHGGDQRSSV